MFLDLNELSKMTEEERAKAIKDYAKQVVKEAFKDEK